MKKILFVSSEAVPFIKTGGLADVAGTLPKSFNKMNRCPCCYPEYRAIPSITGNMRSIAHIFTWILRERIGMLV